MEKLDVRSPLGEYRRYLQEGKLAYQVTAGGVPVFYPRVCAPGDASELTWQVSTGEGTVYSTTTVHGSDGAVHNVVLVDVDEGFRMMSRVDGVPPHAVAIGMRVRMIVGHDEEGEPIPLFVPAAGPGDER